MHDTPSGIELRRAEGILEITWRTEGVRRYGVRQLRCECGCAVCVNEKTGVRILNVSAVPDNIGISNMELVGNYAIRFTFSDGHDTGIYSWDRLFELQSVQ